MVYLSRDKSCQDHSSLATQVPTILSRYTRLISKEKLTCVFKTAIQPKLVY